MKKNYIKLYIIYVILYLLYYILNYINYIYKRMKKNLISAGVQKLNFHIFQICTK